MKASLLLAICLVLLSSIISLVPPSRALETLGPNPSQIAEYSPHLVRISRGTPFSKAAADSFNIYGGRRADGTNDRRPEGQFQNIEFFPDPQGWTSVDLTENPVRWHPSTFNAETLDPLPGNFGMFCGVEAGEPGFTTAPGYGNNYNDNLDWTAVGNVAQNTLVRLEFDFHHDTEPTWDFFHVQYDSAGVWVDWLVLDGTNKDSSGLFTTPVHFDESVLFTPPMYTGSPPVFVSLRIKVTSDSGGSDEDGLFPSSGAVQVDNMKVSFGGNLVTTFGDGIATFEDQGGTPDTEGWMPTAANFAGNFAKVLPALSDPDPCRSDFTPQLGFVDDGTPPSNAPMVSTGGTTSVNWAYGVNGSWVVNYNGGISLGVVGLSNEFRSPEILWDDPGSTEDDGLEGGAFIRFSVWEHLPVQNGLFWNWSVRSTDGGGWTPWTNREFVYYGGGNGEWENIQQDVSDLLVGSPTMVQIALGVVDLASSFAFAGTDATPSPTFDNVSFWRFGLGGPAITARNIDLLNDGFANSGVHDPLGNPAGMSIRLDMARDISTGLGIIPGDSIVVDVVPTIPGTSLNGLPVVKYVLDANPFFDAVRTVPGGAVNMGVTPRGYTQWFGTITADSARTAGGVAVDDRFFVDFPGDGPAIAPHQSSEPAMFFPGDRLRYFVEATDTDMFTTTLPPDTTGFFSGNQYDRLFTVRALPTIESDGGGGYEQTEILVINDFGHTGGEDEFLHAFAQNGMVEDIDFEVYTVVGASSLVSNGIGSAGGHGANPTQLGDYTCMFYMAGDLTDGLLSRGTNLDGNDKGDDLAVLSDWHLIEGDRYMAHFGDDICTFLDESSEGQVYMSSFMGVSYTDNDVNDEIGGTIVPLIQPTGDVPHFAEEYLVYGGCFGLNQFDSILPNISPFSEAAHQFTSDGMIYPPSASVWYDRTVILGSTPYQRVDVTFPYGFQYIYNVGAANGISDRSTLLKEILEGFGRSTNPGNAVPTDPVAEVPFSVSGNRPNPFNPITSIAFFAPTRGHVAVKIYNLRGELVRDLHAGTVDAGSHEVEWNGTDQSGSAVASGVYLYSVQGFGQRITRKMALVK